MDTETVLRVIKMVDAYRDAAYERIKNYNAIDGEYNPYDMGVFDTMSMLSDELQSCIEAQLSAAENQTGE